MSYENEQWLRKLMALANPPKRPMPSDNPNASKGCQSMREREEAAEMRRRYEQGKSTKREW